MRATILFMLVKLDTCSRPLLSQDSLPSLVHHCFLYMRHDKEHSALFLLPETAKYSEKENSKTRDQVNSIICVLFLDSTSLFALNNSSSFALISRKRATFTSKTHCSLPSASGFKELVYFRKQKKTKYLVLLEFQHWEKKKKIQFLPQSFPEKCTFALKVLHNLTS